MRRPVGQRIRVMSGAQATASGLRAFVRARLHIGDVGLNLHRARVVGRWSGARLAAARASCMGHRRVIKRRRWSRSAGDVVEGGEGGLDAGDVSADFGGGVVEDGGYAGRRARPWRLAVRPGACR